MLLQTSRLSRGLLLVLSLFCGIITRAQDEEMPASVFRINAGLLLNRSFSNISEKVEVIDDFSRIERTRSDSADAVKAGFFIGGEALLGKSDRFKGAFALSFARSAAEYHSSYTEEGRTSRVGFTHMQRATELDIKETYFYLDIHAGIRNRIGEGFYLTTGLVMGKPLSATRESQGYVLTTYSASGSPETETTIAYLSGEKKKVKGDANLSFRLRGEYVFTINEKQAALFLFRNFGLIYTLPWWGAGMGFSF